MPPDYPEVGKRKQRTQLGGVFLGGVFRKAPVAHFGQSELALDHSEGVLVLGTDVRVDLVGGKRGQRTKFTRSHGNVPASSPAVSFFNSAIRGIGKDISFRSVQEGVVLGGVMHMGSGASQAMHQARLGIHANMGLHAKVLLITFLGLMHLRISPPRGVLSRARCGDDLGILQQQNHGSKECLNWA